MRQQKDIYIIHELSVGRMSNQKMCDNRVLLYTVLPGMGSAWTHWNVGGVTLLSRSRGIGMGCLRRGGDGERDRDRDRCRDSGRGGDRELLWYGRSLSDGGDLDLDLNIQEREIIV